MHSVLSLDQVDLTCITHYVATSYQSEVTEYTYKRVESVPHQVLTSAVATVRHYAVIYGMFRISKY